MASSASTRPTAFNTVANANALGDWLGLFLRFPGPRVIVALLALSLVARVAAGGFRLLDLLIAGAVVAAQPFTEWLLHVFVLHFRPRRAGNRTIDLPIARKHREHHVDPTDIRLTLIHIPSLLGLVIIYAAGMAAGFRDPSLALTGICTGYAVLLIYEWMHYLIHSPYVPRSRLYRTIWRSHRLHHFKNEHYWFGVTNPVGDIVLRTYPAKESVPTSHTARTLGLT